MNERPTAIGDTATTNEDTATSIDILENDLNPEGGTVTLNSSPAQGSATLEADNTVTYTPDPDAHGIDKFTCSISSSSRSNPADVFVTVNPVNDPPQFATSTAERIVAESAIEGDHVGAAFAATDVYDEVLSYSLSGPGGAFFEIELHVGQIKVRPEVVLDTTSRPAHMVTVIAQDPDSARAELEVTITVSETAVTPVIAPVPSLGCGSGGGGGGGGGGPSPSNIEFEWTVSRDIEELDSDHGFPTGAWSDGVTLWIAENGQGADDAIYAYDLATGERLEDREFALDETNRAPRGVWSDGVTTWVSDSGQDKLFAYDLASGERLPDSDLELPRANGDTRGSWSDGVTMWVLDGNADALFGYDLASGDLLAEYALDTANDDPRGIWSDGVTVWVSDHGAKRLFAYRLPALDEADAAAEEDAALERVRDEEFTNLSRAGNNSPRGIRSDGDVMYVGDASDGKVYTYNMPDATDARLASLTLSDVDFGEFSPGQPEYAGVAADGVTETTVEASAMYRRATVVVEPADTDTGTFPDGLPALTPLIARSEGPPSPAPASDDVTQPWPDCLRGDIATGFSLVLYEGGSVDELDACAQSLDVTTVYALVEGEYVPYILGAPGFVNEPFRELFPDGLGSVTPLIAKSN